MENEGQGGKRGEEEEEEEDEEKEEEEVVDVVWFLGSAHDGPHTREREGYEWPPDFQCLQLGNGAHAQYIVTYFQLTYPVHWTMCIAWAEGVHATPHLCCKWRIGNKQCPSRVL